MNANTKARLAALALGNKATLVEPKGSGIREADKANKTDANAVAPKAKGKGKKKAVDFARMPVAKALTIEAAADVDRANIDAEATLLDYLSAEQVETIEIVSGIAMRRAIVKQEADEELAKLWEEATAAFDAQFATPLTWADWQPITSAIRLALGASAAMTFRNLYRALHDELPSAGTGTGEGSKGVSPGRCAKAFNTTTNKLADWIDKTLVPQGDAINADVLALVSEAVEAMHAANAMFTAKHGTSKAGKKAA